MAGGPVAGGLQVALAAREGAREKALREQHGRGRGRDGTELNPNLHVDGCPCLTQTPARSASTSMNGAQREREAICKIASHPDILWPGRK